MSKPFFNKKQRRSCAWCIFGKNSEYNNDVFCQKRGLVSAEEYCGKYKYDPLKREPSSAFNSKKFTAEDFKI